MYGSEGVIRRLDDHALDAGASLREPEGVHEHVPLAARQDAAALSGGVAEWRSGGDGPDAVREGAADRGRSGATVHAGTMALHGQRQRPR